jgi:hypothetical protein
MTTAGASAERNVRRAAAVSQSQSSADINANSRRP